MVSQNKRQVALLGMEPACLEAADSWAEGLWNRVPDESDSPDRSCDILPLSEKRANKGASIGPRRGFNSDLYSLECC